MNEDLRSLLFDIARFMLIGAVVGIVLRLWKPQWCRSWTKSVLNRQWKLFTLGAILFGAGAIGLWLDGQIYTAGLCLLMCALELVALFRYGFTPLTPEMERRIDES